VGGGGDYKYKCVAASTINASITGLHRNKIFIIVHGNYTYQMHATTYMDFFALYFKKKSQRAVLELNKFCISPNPVGQKLMVNPELSYLYRVIKSICAPDDCNTESYK
jgi:hypothetical protein